jgi:hypothetical protein
MKHPCRTMCTRDNKMVISRGGLVKGEESLGMGGGRVAVCRSAFLTCYRTAATRNHRIFSYPSGPDRSKSTFSLSQSSSTDWVFAYCHNAYISPGSCKGKV